MKCITCKGVYPLDKGIHGKYGFVCFDCRYGRTHKTWAAQLSEFEWVGDS